MELLLVIFSLSAIIALLLAIEARRATKLTTHELESLGRDNLLLKQELEKLREHITQKIIASAKLSLEARESTAKLQEEVILIGDELIELKMQVKQLPALEALQTQGATTATPAPQIEAAARPDAETIPAPAVNSLGAAWPVEEAPPATQDSPPTSEATTTQETSPANQESTSAARAMSQPKEPQPPPQSPGAAPGAFDWEGLIGVKLFSWLAGIALSIAAVFLIRYSLDQSWFTPTIRVVLGFVVGVALLVGGESKAARTYAVTANALEAGGIAILYITLFGASAWWKLIPPLAGFGLAAVVTALSVFLSYRNGSLFIGILGLVSGFAAPALFSTGQDNAIGLFGYMLLLDSAFWWLTYAKKWPGLLDASVVLTAVYQWGWLYKFFIVAKLPIAVGAFLLFPVLGFVAFWLVTRRQQGAEQNARFLLSACINAALPLLFAGFLIFVAQEAAVDLFFYGLLAPLLLGYFVVGLLFKEERLHLLGSFASLLLLALWVLYATTASEPLALYAVVVGSLFYLLAPLVAARLGRAASEVSEGSALLAPLFLFYFPALQATHPSWLSLGLFLGLGLGLCVVSLASKRSVLYALSMSAALFSLLCWGVLVEEESWPTILMFAAAPFVALGLSVVRLVPASDEKSPTPLWWSGRQEFLSAAMAAGGLFMAQIIAGLAGQNTQERPLSLWLGWYLLLVLGFFWHSLKSGWETFLVFGAFSSMSAISAWPMSQSEGFLLGLPLYLAFLVFPVALGGRAKGSLSPGLSAVVASGFLLAFGVEYLDSIERPNLLPLLFVGEAGLLGLLFFRQLSLAPTEQRRQPQLVLLASASILLLTIAIPLQFKRELLPMAWAAESVLLLVLYHRVLHRWLLALSVALLTLSWALLSVNPEVLLYYPRTETPLWNWFLYCYPCTAAAFFVASALCGREVAPTALPETTETESQLLSPLREALLSGWGPGALLPRKSLALLCFAGGVTLLFILLNIEIADFFSEGPALQFRFLSERVAEGLAYTLGWAAFAIGLLIVGIVMKQQTIRVASIVLLSGTTLKCFLLDLGNLGGLYRVGAFVGLAFALAGVALLLQRFVMRRDS